LQIKLRASLDEEIFGSTARRGSRPKRVRYLDTFESGRQKEHHPGLVKEEIEIPKPAPRNIGRVEHIIAAIMSGGERQMRGLTGKPLVYGKNFQLNVQEANFSQILYKHIRVFGRFSFWL
jgi:hypothetical protein